MHLGIIQLGEIEKLSEPINVNDGDEEIIISLKEFQKEINKEIRDKIQKELDQDNYTYSSL